MTAVPTEPVPCVNPPLGATTGKPVKGRTHRPTILTGHCQSGHHGSCSGHYTHPCGCVVPCRCTAPGHPDDRRHPFQEEPVLPDPFTVPTAEEEPAPVAGEQPLPETVEDWTHAIQTRRPWIDGTGEDPAEMQVVVTMFAMAAGDLIAAVSDGPEDYDEQGLMAMLGILRAAVRRAGLLDAMIVKHLWDHHPHGLHHLPDLGEVRTYRRDARVKWDERGTGEAIIDAKMEERGGVLPDDPREVLTWLLEGASIGYYRKTALRALGIDPQDFYTSEKGTLAVDVPIPD